MTTHNGDAGALSEAAAPENFLDRVKALDYGETAKLKGGISVMKAKSHDDREVYKVGRPSHYSNEDRFDEGHHRTPEDAVSGAFMASARSEDPDSIGGKERIETYGEYTVDDGAPTRVRGFNTKGHALVADRYGAPKRAVPVHKLKRKRRDGWLGEQAHTRGTEADVRGRLQESDAPADDGLMLETLALLEVDGLLGEDDSQMLAEALAESEKTASLSVKHAPIGKGGTNWITADKPGNTGQLPAYVQNVRNAIVRGGKSVGEATGIAIGRIRAWAKGGGKVGPEVVAAATKALAEYDAMLARAKAKRGSTRKEEAFWLEETRGATVRGAR